MEEDFQEQEHQKPEENSKKKKRKLGKKSFFLLFLFALLGALGGLHLTGAWDARPFLYRTVPSIPFVGDRLAAWFHVPAEYSLSSEERRDLDLRKRKEMLQEWERELREKEALLGELSRDMVLRNQVLLKQEEVLSRSLAEKKEEPAEDAEEKNIQDLLRVYSEMSSRNAAEIMQNLSAELAVTLLGRMPQDQAGKILAKMEPQKAAYLTRQLAQRPGTDSK